MEILEIEINGLEYELEVDVYTDEDEVTGEEVTVVELIDIHLSRNGMLYAVSNERTWEHVESLDLVSAWKKQCN